MSLFGSLSIGASAINTSQLALSIVGNNIANAGTEGYVREELKIGTLPSTRFGSLSIGTGASAISTKQQIDRFLRERARQAGSEFEAANARSALFDRVQTAFNELGERDISTALNDFFSSIQNLANRPDDLALRDIVVKKGALAAGQISFMRTKLEDVSKDISTEVEQSASQINGILESIRDLNRQIVAAEAGSFSDAGGLRSKRDQELSTLSKLIPIQTATEADGSLNVLIDGDFLLFNGTIQEVAAIDGVGSGIDTKILALRDSQWPIPVNGGRLGGIQEFRDSDLEGLAGQLDKLAAALIYEFNKIHSSGQGTQKLTQLEGTYRSLAPSDPLTSASNDLPFTPTNGSFDINVTDSATGLTRTFKIDVDLDGIGTDDSLNNVITRINTVAFGGQPVASVSNQGRVRFSTTGVESFTLGNDSSGFLASFGLNTFFTGTSARDINVNDFVLNNPNNFAASKNGLPGDNSNALALAQFSDNKFEQLNGESLSVAVTGLVKTLASEGKFAQSARDVTEASKNALESEDLSITGVSLDEEAVKLIKFQRSFQASAKYIQTINDLLTEVINIIR